MSNSDNGRGPIYGSNGDNYYTAISEAVITAGSPDVVVDSITLHENLNVLPEQYRLPLTMLEAALRTPTSEREFFHDPNLNVDPKVLLDAIQPDNLVNAIESRGMLYRNDSCLMIPVDTGMSQMLLHIPGNSTVQTENNFIGVDNGRVVLENVFEDVQTTFLLSDPRGSDKIFLLSSHRDGEDDQSVPTIAQITKPSVAQFYGWDRGFSEHILDGRSGATQFEDRTSESHLNKSVEVAKRVVRGAINSPDRVGNNSESIVSGEVRQALIDQLFDEEVEELTTHFLPDQNVSGKSVVLYLPETGDARATLLERCDVVVHEGNRRDISYYLLLNTWDDENNLQKPVYKLTCTIDEYAWTHSYSIESIGDLDELEPDFFAPKKRSEDTPEESTDSEFEQTEPNLTEYEIIEAQNYVDHIISRLPEITDEGDIIALQAMKLSPNGPKIDELVDALIQKRESDPHIPIHLAISRSSVENDEDAKQFNRMTRAGIQLHWTDQAYNHPYSGFNHRKLFVLGKECGIGGVNLESDSLGFLDWMISFPDNEMLRKIITQKIVNESEPFRMRPLEFELYQMTPGRESYVPTDSVVDLERFVEGCFRGERMGYIAENAYSDQESALIDAAVMAINRAQESVTVMGQWMPDGRVREALLDALKRQPNLEVNIISNSGRAHINEAIPHRGPKDKLVYGGAYYYVQMFWTRSFLNLFKRLSGDVNGRLNILTIDNKLVHAKLIMVDQKVMIIGSDNLIQSGAKYRTRESGMIISIDDIVYEFFLRIQGLIDSEEHEWKER